MQGVSLQYKLLHTAYRATYVTLMYDSLPTIIAKGIETSIFKTYFSYLRIDKF